MKPSTEKLTFQRNREDEIQEFVIKKKDYGVAVFFDIYFNNIFLFSLAEDGVVLIDNWEIARREPIGLDEDSFEALRIMIKKEAAKSKLA